MCLSFVVLVALNGFAQGVIRGRVTDKKTAEPLTGAVVRVHGRSDMGTVTDDKGYFVMKLGYVNAEKIDISFIGYTTLTDKLVDQRVYQLEPSSTLLNDVVVTATESKGLTSSSKIAKHAMEHLQPSSFADVLELLPGGMAHDPSLSTPNTITLREAGISSSQYNTSSLGTSFVIDGARRSSNANMQFVDGAWDTQTTYRDFTNAGVDMRTISTDDIDNIEIVRGIPSVEYGDLTSGLVKINRRKGGNDISARLKTDMSSKLFYVAKGFEWVRQQLSLNVSIDYLDSKNDPRNLLETYKRVTLSARLNKRWNKGQHQYAAGLNLDYGGSFDDDKIDPELNYGGVDNYVSSYNRYGADLSLDMTNKNQQSILESWSALLAFSYEKDKTERTRLVQLDRETPAATTTTDGESWATLITPYTYTATHTVDGQPLNLFAKMNAVLRFPIKGVSNKLKVGADWTLDKNLGDGQVFDPYHPLYTGISARQRRYKDIPSEQTLSGYAEERLTTNIGRHKLEVEAGLRASTMLNLNSQYTLHGKWYLDPRVNMGWTFPAIRVGKHQLVVMLAGGYGEHTKFPTIDQLYPEKTYIDLVEMNYWHSNKAYRGMYLQTYVVDPTNWQLEAARNRKWEVRADITLAGNRLSVTYFQEDMRSGFRSEAIYDDYPYKKYDTSGIDPKTITSVPDPATLPVSTIDELNGYSHTINGSRTLKKGWEYMLTTIRFPVILTRLTITGAYFKTQYQNSLNVMEIPSRMVAGERLHYAGIYKDDDGYIREMWNTNFTFDTDVPRLKLGFSISAQCMWQTASQNMPKENYPIQYMDRYGNVYDFTEADAKDTYKQFLVRTNNSSLYERQTVPFYMNLNFKATKKFLDNHLTVALFVNKLLDAHPDYIRNDYRIRRYVTPYFGLEANIRL